jgi:hypothetical protein
VSLGVVADLTADEFAARTSETVKKMIVKKLGVGCFFSWHLLS